MHRRKLLATGLSLAVPAVITTPARAQAYPSQPIRWIVPYPAGGGTDVVARTLAEEMKAGLGQQIIVDNKPGAATIIGAEALKQSKPDGYTIGTGDTSTLSSNPHLYKALPYDPAKDFVLIGMMARFNLLLVVHPSVEAKTVKEFIALRAAAKEPLGYATPGIGTPHHLAMELFNQRSGSKGLHVPYKGAAPAVQDLIAGQVPSMFLDLAAGIQHVRASKVRVLAVASAKRLAALPDVPTLAEAGVADSEAYALQGLAAPTGTPQPIVERLNAALVKAISSAAVVKRFDELGVEPISSTPEQFAETVRAESTKWGTLIKELKISLD
ncbi:tripartite tricarboxylate transporter substrate binding protein [Reyranella sp. CPCC 100927]|uniref:Bug family tripartite tricarboxylate transporter substrate binding protein n=1 Tax=Reyranella sp. CPCC 100927 TaxID=2599616 RepID=UPI0011B43606|nr:tripartite tricarboxylate transporter substrate binding protein [Reyranella sp. CPCC 100927]TWS93976.1 tripartite tricarboxylate transporter substrate binding protein [Reyranella sp. CPCC 100927]